jgi:hypothetical protein
MLVYARLIFTEFFHDYLTLVPISVPINLENEPIPARTRSADVTATQGDSCGISFRPIKGAGLFARTGEQIQSHLVSQNLPGAGLHSEAYKTVHHHQQLLEF